jgi:glucose-1-phosphate thymidylyltransferase
MVNPPPSGYVGLIPAAGIASRLPGLTLSKELLPYGNDVSAAAPVISHLVGAFRQAGVTDVIVVLRHGKQDVADFLATSDFDDFDFRHRFTPGTDGVPQTVALALDDCSERNILLGFPDILFEPSHAFTAMIDRLENTAADVVLGLFPAGTPEKMDMVDVAADGRIREIVIKPARTSLDLTWILAAWRPAFSRYLGEAVRDADGRLAAKAEARGGNHLGHVLELAIDDGLLVDSVAFRAGRTLDIGTPADLVRARAWRRNEPSAAGPEE